MKIRYLPGFTLIELLVVISIVAILGVGLIAVINPGEKFAQSRDKLRIAGVKQISSAIQRYRINSGGIPPINRTPGAGYCANQANFLQELVSSGELKSIPKDPGSGNYCYYDYGAGNDIGALVVATLEEIDNTTTPPEGSCRPFASSNWCSSTVASKYYCVCNPY